MKKILLSGIASGLLLLCACSTGGSPVTPTAPQEETLHILTTTYPVYLFTRTVTDQKEGVEVSLLVNQQTSCLHDYTLTVNDMKAIESADVIVMNGAGLEDFMKDALATSDAPVIDCSEGVELLPALGHEGHDHDTEYDPHYWMDPRRALQMYANIAEGLSEIDARCEYDGMENLLMPYSHMDEQIGEMEQTLAALSDRQRGLVTFHDGFQYFCDAFDLQLLAAIEEEEGSEASAADIREIMALIQEHTLPAIFTEVNGSDATARAISRETGAAVYQLDMIMSGDEGYAQAYLDVMWKNVNTVLEALG